MEDKLKSEDKRKYMISKLQELIEFEGWQLIVEYLKENLAGLTDDILNIDTKLTIKDLEILKLKMFYQKKLMVAPQKLIEAIEEYGKHPEEKDKQFDIYN